MRAKILTIMTSLAVAALVAGCASVPTADQIPANITNARTAADHQRIADFFAQKAASYDAEADSHKKMGRSYTARPKGEPSSMIAHCQRLQEQFIAAAGEARELEKAHRQLANTAK
jgi:hypothetical protein